MLRAVILAMVVVVALGMLIPVATEQTEAGAKEQVRQEMKKERAEKFRYRSRFRLASYSRSERFIHTAKLVDPGDGPIKPIKKIKTFTNIPEKAVAETKADEGGVFEPESAEESSAPSGDELTPSTGEVRRTVSSRRTRVRYRKVSRVRSKSSYARVKRTSSKRSSNRKTVKRSKRKYTARWWHNYRARQRQQSSLARRKAAMRERREELQRQHASAIRPYGFVAQADSQVTDDESANLDLTQLVLNADGTVSLVVVGRAVGETIDYGRRRTLAGVSVTALRRTVIEQMIKENGWVENDYQKDVDGKKVYVVVAKAPDSKNQIRAKTYYFTESQGNIYRIAATAPEDEPREAEVESEKVVRTLQEKERPQQASNEGEKPQQPKIEKERSQEAKNVKERPQQAKTEKVPANVEK